MGQGIDLAREMGNTVHADAIDDLKEQLLLVLIRRLGGDVRIPCDEIDSTGQLVLEMSLNADTREFRFVIKGKH